MAEFIKPMEWNSEGIEPSETLKKEGFKGGYKPPAEIFNYFLHNSEACIKELQNAVTEAQDTADDASTLASDAQSTADEAKLAASRAQTTASTAKTAAVNAQNTADDAITAIEELETDIEQKYATKDEISHFVVNAGQATISSGSTTTVSCSLKKKYIKIYNENGALVISSLVSGTNVTSVCARIGNISSVTDSDFTIFIGAASSGTTFYWEVYGEQ